MGISGISTTFATYNLQQTNKKVANVLDQLASGSTLSASQNPAAIAESTSLTSQSQSYNAANEGISLSQGALATASGGLSAVSSQLQSLQSIAVQSANGTLSDSQRAGLQNQFDQTLQSINSVAQNTNFNGQNLLDGSFNISIQTGPQAGQSTQVSVGSVSANALGLSSQGVATQTGGQNALTAIQNAITQVNSEQASVGAAQNSLSVAANVNSVASENLQAANSRIGGVDLAKASSDLNQYNAQRQFQLYVLKAGLNAKKTSASNLSQLLSGTKPNSDR